MIANFTSNDIEKKIRSVLYAVDKQVTLGKITDNSQYYQTGKVRVTLISIGDDLQLDCPVVQLLTTIESRHYGSVSIPQVGEMVLVAFLDSALKLGVVIARWNYHEACPLPIIDEVKDKLKGLFRYTITPSGMVILIYDDGTEAFVKIRDLKEQMKLYFDVSQRLIEIQADKEYLKLNGKEQQTEMVGTNISISAEKNLTLQAEEITQKSVKTEIKVEKDYDMTYKRKSEQGDSLNIASGKIQLKSNRNKMNI